MSAKLWEENVLIFQRFSISKQNISQARIKPFFCCCFCWSVWWVWWERSVRFWSDLPFSSVFFSERQFFPFYFFLLLSTSTSICFCWPRSIVCQSKAMLLLLLLLAAGGGIIAKRFCLSLSLSFPFPSMSLLIFILEIANSLPFSLSLSYLYCLAIYF